MVGFFLELKIMPAVIVTVLPGSMDFKILVCIVQAVMVLMVCYLSRQSTCQKSMHADGVCFAVDLIPRSSVIT